MSGNDTIHPIDRATAEALLEAARQARGHAYAPYSGFPVGAALLDAEGRIFTGVNVENASYGLAMCAERAAVIAAVGAGARSFRALAVAGPDDGAECPPCGSCRQVLFEFAPAAIVVLAGEGGATRQVPMRQLLPDAFGPYHLADRDRSGA